MLGARSILPQRNLSHQSLHYAVFMKYIGILRAMLSHMSSCTRVIHLAQKNLMQPCSPQDLWLILELQELNQKLCSLRMLRRILHPPP